ncbi:MAG: hypothetical protein KGL18_16335 [Burkholderiales bacterium]|nr:hypothetical protein [Burkholderiales bacterium]MDE1928306.1 hypothetical protein [Burkholderiales bacterium]MDE2159184.1 hypothetical protein [Burkholderiales bacterium]MDE2504534.1 hypothetical protein [Burkholderiales bacterium]
MPALSRLALCLSLSGLSCVCAAQVLAASASAPHESASAPARSRLAPRIHVIEDKAVRIEETRFGGQAQRITVQPKIPGGARPYDILVGKDNIGVRDTANDHGAAGQSAWSLFDF